MDKKAIFKNEIKGIEIREMKETDISEVAQIELEAELGFWGEKSYSDELKRQDSIALTAFLNNEVVGFLVARLLMSDAEIYNIAVKNNFRRCGIGENLLIASFGQFAVEGVKEVFLEVRAGNSGAQCFYLKHGFTKIGERKHFYQNPPEDAFLYRKILLDIVQKKEKIT